MFKGGWFTFKSFEQFGIIFFYGEGNCRLFIILRNVECFNRPFQAKFLGKSGVSGQTTNCVMSFSLPILSWTIVLRKRELTGRKIAQSHDF